MKKGVLAVAMVLFAAAYLSAATIETETERDTIYNRPRSVVVSFGKPFSSEEYGIFLNIKCRVDENQDDTEALFFRLKSGVIKEGDNLYTMLEGEKVVLASKKWLGWKTADGVEIQYSMERSSNPKFKVWVTVD